MSSVGFKLLAGLTLNTDLEVGVLVLRLCGDFDWTRKCSSNVQYFKYEELMIILAGKVL